VRALFGIGVYFAGPCAAASRCGAAADKQNPSRPHPREAFVAQMPLSWRCSGRSVIAPTLSGFSGDVEGIVRDGLKHFAKHEVMEGKHGPPIQQAK
jgi:hypothetical protein